jgi:hypothetical protein
MIRTLALAALMVASTPIAADAHGRVTNSRTCLTSPAKALLAAIEAAHGPVRLTSTCRPGARVRGSNRISRHASGNAIDFDAGNRKSQVVSWLIRNHRSGGVMTYARSRHIHVDIGPRFVLLNHGGDRKPKGLTKSKHSRYASS